MGYIVNEFTVIVFECADELVNFIEELKFARCFNSTHGSKGQSYLAINPSASK